MHRGAISPSATVHRLPVHRRFRRWQTAGIWDQVHSATAHDDRIDGSITMIDSSSIRVHQHAAEARKQGTRTRTTASDASGRDNESGSKAYDRTAYRERPIIERTINRLKRYRRIAWPQPV